MKITCPDCQQPIEIIDSPKIKKLQSQGDFWDSLSYVSVIVGLILLILSFPSMAYGNFGMVVLSAAEVFFGFSIVAYFLSHIIYLRLDILSQGK